MLFIWSGICFTSAGIFDSCLGRSMRTLQGKERIRVLVNTLCLQSARKIKYTVRFQPCCVPSLLGRLDALCRPQSKLHLTSKLDSAISTGSTMLTEEANKMVSSICYQHISPGATSYPERVHCHHFIELIAILASENASRDFGGRRLPRWPPYLVGFSTQGWGQRGRVRRLAKQCLSSAHQDSESF